MEIDGKVVSASSPQVMSKSAESSKNKIEIEPFPCARHGVGPSNWNSRRMEKTPTPKALSDTEADISMMKWKGENWNKASNWICPSMPKSSSPKTKCAAAPN